MFILETDLVTGVTIPLPQPAADPVEAVEQAESADGKTKKKKERKDKRIMRVAAGDVWEDSSLLEWDDKDFRCGFRSYNL